MMNAYSQHRPWCLVVRLLLPLLARAAVVVSTPVARDVDAPPFLDVGDGMVPEYVTRHAPLVWLHSEDPFRPSDLLQHIRHTRPLLGRDPVPDLPDDLGGDDGEGDDGLTLDNLALLNAFGGEQVALTTRGDDVSALPAWLLGEEPDAEGRVRGATPCVVVLVEKDSGSGGGSDGGVAVVDAFYFYFYSYDRGPNITQVMEPMASFIDDGSGGGGMHFGDHVGDWKREHNMVRFENGRPTGIYYSQHRDGTAYGWDDEALTMTDERPLVYSAYGSHANYESEGIHVHDKALLDYCDAGKLWDPVLSAYFYHWDPSTRVLTPLHTANTTSPTPTPGEASSNDSSSKSNITSSFFYFAGRWGDAQYPDSHPLQRTIPRFGLKRFVSGPRGPIVKNLVRRGLYPDRRRVDTWAEWAVGIFMALYPCCFRGWRAWVTVTVVVGGFGVGVVVLVRRWGCCRYCGCGCGWMRRRREGRGYERVGTEIPLDDLTTTTTTTTTTLSRDGGSGRRSLDA